MDKPMISVIMGVYNGCPTMLEQAIRSILAQTMTDLEFIICDDGSCAETWQKLLVIAATDARIRLLKNKENHGLAYSLNRCLAVAQGAFIARMDSDDISYPERLEKQLQALYDDPSLSFFGTAVNLLQNDVIVEKKIFPVRPMVKNFYMTQPYIHPTLLFRRSCLEAVSGYSEHPNQLFCEDYDLLLRLYARGYIGGNLDEILFDYRIPTTAKGSRTMSHRFNEVLTRYERFRELGCLPVALPFIIKPLIVGMLPEIVLQRCKSIYHDIAKE